MRDPVFRISSKVASYYGITVERMLSRERSKSVSEARHMAMWIVRERLALSYPEIGSEFAKRDHQSTMRAIKKIAALSGQALRVRSTLYDATGELGAA